MVTFCCICGNQITLEQENGTSVPVKCECGANGFATYMTIEPNNKHPNPDTNKIITLQMIKRIK